MTTGKVARVMLHNSHWLIWSKTICQASIFSPQLAQLRALMMMENEETHQTHSTNNANVVEDTIA